MKELIRKLKKDKSYREAWEANIAMAFKDEAHRVIKKNGSWRLNAEDIHEIGNKAAENFLQLLCKE